MLGTQIYHELHDYIVCFLAFNINLLTFSAVTSKFLIKLAPSKLCNHNTNTMEPIKYIAQNERDEQWGLTVCSVGYQKIAAGERMKKWRNKMNEDEDMDDMDDGDMNDDVD